MYVVCQTSRCQQTYSKEYFGVVTKETKNVSCEKCGGILIDENGRANFSGIATVRPVITISEIEEGEAQELKRKRKQLKEKRQEMKTLTKEIRELEESKI